VDAVMDLSSALQASCTYDEGRSCCRRREIRGLIWLGSRQRDRRYHVKPRSYLSTCICDESMLMYFQKCCAE
jgi:hypothetical protein